MKGFLKDSRLYDLVISTNPEITNYDIEQCISEAVEENGELVQETIRLLKMEESAMKEEMARMRELKKGRVDAISQIKEIVIREMKDRGIKKIYTGLGNGITVRRCAPKAVIVDYDSIPEEYIKVERKPSLSKLKAAHKKGELPEGIMKLTENYSLLT